MQKYTGVKSGDLGAQGAVLPLPIQNSLCFNQIQSNRPGKNAVKLLKNIEKSYLI